MKNNLRKGFTIIELLVVIAIIGILAGTVIPKLIKEIRKATVAKVQHNLGVIRSRLSLDETFLDEFPDLYDETEIDLLDTYRILDTPGFTNSSGVSHEATSQVVDSRNDTGGWYYIRSTGEIFANLPNGAYTKDSEYEIWNGEDEEIVDDEGTVEDNDTDDEATEDNSGTDWDNIEFPATELDSSKVWSGSGGDYYEFPWGTGKYITSINPGVGYLGINGAKLNGNYAVYIDGNLIESGSKTTNNNDQAIQISSHNIDVPNNSKLLTVAFEYVDSDGQTKIVYNNTDLY